MAQVAQHRAGFHRRQLILVAEQDQCRLRRQGGQQRRHHFQVDHRGFIDDQHIDIQLVAGVVLEGARVGPCAQQAVQGTRRAHARRQFAQRQSRADFFRQFIQRISIDCLSRAAALPVGAASATRSLAPPAVANSKASKRATV
jgi:hypothetical protein